MPFGARSRQHVLPAQRKRVILERRWSACIVQSQAVLSVIVLDEQAKLFEASAHGDRERPARRVAGDDPDPGITKRVAVGIVLVVAERKGRLLKELLGDAEGKAELAQIAPTSDRIGRLDPAIEVRRARDLCLQEDSETSTRPFSLLSRQLSPSFVAGWPW